MGRNSWIMFGMITVAIISIVLVALLVLMPQSEPLSTVELEDYESISKPEYSYTQSKDITEESMKEVYTITSEDIKEGKASKLYKQGNADPFKDVNSSGNASGANNNSANGNNGGNNTNTNTNTDTGANTGNSTNTNTGNSNTNTDTTEPPVSAEDK